ncbi:MAG: biopolymer transporter ExbD [Rickettsiales bacterium]|jgi:biopolymer transport protein TolR|nr:biopolymer transporter ExbD [Rickettsiales bacterium]
MARRNSLRNNSEMQLTPMIDIMTVLMAVFMITAPMLTSGIDLDLPRAGHSAMTGDDHAAQVSVDAQGRYFIGETQDTRENIVKRLVAQKGENPKLTIMINGDRGASYGTVMSMMGALKDAGFQKVGLRTRTED